MNINRSNLKFQLEKTGNRATTLIEALIAIAVFIIIVVPIYWSYSNILDVISKNQSRSQALALVQNEIETIRNMPYDEVGIVGGSPAGQLPANQTITYQNNTFTLQAIVRNVDDPFDDSPTSTPSDSSPADYKLVALTINCISCVNFTPLIITTTVAPPGLETAANSGSLFINVFDANGNPVNLANVQVTNNNLSPIININDTTNVNGVLQLIGLPTSTASYHIVVTKPGYSSDQTYPLGNPTNPNPIKPDATVAKNKITNVSFAIDRTSTLNVTTADQMCTAIPSIPFGLVGMKLIGLNPNIPKNSISSQTNLAGAQTLTNIEWDSYNFQASSSAYDLAGYAPLSPLIINPATTSSLALLMILKNPSALLVTVESASGTPLNGASVELATSTFDQILTSGERLISQTDWSGSNYAIQNGFIDSESVSGELQLVSSTGNYTTSTGWLISNNFDFGTASTTFDNLTLNPQSQPPQTGNNSLGIQIATNNDNSTWNFLGPDGTTGSYYTTSSTLNPIHNGNRYLRYKIYLQTSNSNFTPILKGIYLSFSSACVPSGQVFWNGLAPGDYNLTVSEPGYQTFTDTLTINAPWQEYSVILNP